MLKLTFHSDPGHGWVAVRQSLLHELGIASQVSPYSYLHGGIAYLEEDCDASLLMDALAERGIKVTIGYRTTNIDSRIRSYDRYDATAH